MGLPIKSLLMKQGAGSSVDPFFSQVVTLPNFVGPDGSTTITDAIPGISWSSAGGASLNSNELALPGVNAYLIDTVPNAIGTGDFCIEVILKPGAIGSAMEIFSISNAVSSARVDLVFEITSAGNVRFSLQALGVAFVDITTSGLILNTSQYYHIAGIMDGTSARVTIDGVSYATGTVVGVRTNAETELSIGRLVTVPTRYMNGRYKALRLTKNRRYSTFPFTPPTAPFPTS